MNQNGPRQNGDAKDSQGRDKDRGNNREQEQRSKRPRPAQGSSRGNQGRSHSPQGNDSRNQQRSTNGHNSNQQRQGQKPGGKQNRPGGQRPFDKNRGPERGRDGRDKNRDDQSRNRSPQDDKSRRSRDHVSEETPASPLRNLPSNLPSSNPLKHLNKLSRNESSEDKTAAASLEAKRVQQRFGVIFYDTFPLAKADLIKLRELEKQYDQLNIVIRAEGNMDDPELATLEKAKVFAGTAWALIHERRKQENWYEEPH